MKYNNLIVGAGITGITLAEQLAKRNESVLIIDKREHIGGNCYDYFDEKNNYIQKYGPHIFHTHSKKIWDYFSKFTEWKEYNHEVLANINDKLLPIPFNFHTIDKIYETSEADTIKSLLISEFGENKKVPILELKKSYNEIIRELSDYIYKNIFLHYSMKQWGLKPEEIDSSVTARVPIFIGYNNQYFPNQFQGMPKKGFTALFHKMLNDENINILLNKSFEEVKNTIQYDRMFYTGSIDSFFNYDEGKIKYRNVNLELETHNTNSYQANSVINYTVSETFTRITEFNKFLSINNSSTIIAKEYPSWDKGFVAWPLQTDSNKKMINKYLLKANKLENCYFLGRLAEGKYYDMDQAINRAMEIIHNVK